MPRPLSAGPSRAARGAVVPGPCDLQRSRTSGGQQGQGHGAVQALPGGSGAVQHFCWSGMAPISAKTQAKVGKMSVYVRLEAR